MDSPHLLHLGFLLLALAAPHPSIAMSTGGSARSTQGSTTMTIYRCCKDCEGCKRKDGRIDFENFTRIAEIQNKTNTIPGVTVEFVASDSHMTVCFEQANFCPEEIYGMSKETVPPKHWCGILNTGENGGGDINTEDKTVCCEGEADPWQYSDLKCYIQKSNPKHTALSVVIPGIAMSTGGSARWTQGSTNMTVYCCKDCESCKYKDGEIDFENCKRIAEIQNKTNTVPGVTVEFVANESHMTISFEQANFCPEEIYGISDKTVPPKFWCGILNTGENGGGDINTEDKTVCCEGEADPLRHNTDLKCYIQKSHLRLAMPVAIPGNPESLPSKKSSLGVLLAFLFVGVCTGWGTMFYFLRLRRRQDPRQDREVLTEKSSHSLDDHLQGRKLLGQQHPPPLS